MHTYIHTYLKINIDTLAEAHTHTVFWAKSTNSLLDAFLRCRHSMTMKQLLIPFMVQELKYDSCSEGHGKGRSLHVSLCVTYPTVAINSGQVGNPCLFHSVTAYSLQWLSVGVTVLSGITI